MSEVHNKCASHPHQNLEFFCSICKTCACKDCEHFIGCFNDKHDVIPMKIAVDRFNKEATEVTEIYKNIKEKLEATFYSIFEEKSDFEEHLKLCRTAIEIQTKTIIQKVQQKSEKLMLDLENIYKQKNEVIENQVKKLESKQIKLQSLMTSVTKLMNKPEEFEMLESLRKGMNDFRHVVKWYSDKSTHERKLAPNFIPCTHLDKIIRTEGIGKIVDNRHIIDKDDTVITVTKGQPFVVKVSSLTENDTYQLSGNLLDSPVKESAIEVKHQGRGEYSIHGRCNVEGDWQMEITSGNAHIKGSPVKIKVESLGLVHTVDNILDYQVPDKESKVIDVVSDTDGCILVSSYSNEILKFNQSGSFVARIQVPQDGNVGRMHQLGDGHIVYSDEVQKCVVLCDDKFQQIRSFGKGILTRPRGLTVNKKTRILYVADRKTRFVFKFNIDDGTLLGKIDSEDRKKPPCDITLTMEGNLVVAHHECGKIQMFDVHDTLMAYRVRTGPEDGEIRGPCGVTIDADGNILVSSNHKLQLFDQNGVFIKRIDNKDDGLYFPSGICIISNRPRRVAVANTRAQNVKIFNY